MGQVFNKKFAGGGWGDQKNGEKAVILRTPQRTPTFRIRTFSKSTDLMLQFSVLVLTTKEFKSQNFL